MCIRDRVHLSPEDFDHMRGVLRAQLAEAYTASPRSDIVISYESPVGLTATYTINSRWYTVAGAYDNWIATREPPLFGTEPDARVWDLAAEAPDPAQFRVLDIGAGTGRNTLALARHDHPVEAVEMTGGFADLIRAEAAKDRPCYPSDAARETRRSDHACQSYTTKKKIRSLLKIQNL